MGNRLERVQLLLENRGYVWWDCFYEDSVYTLRDAQIWKITTVGQYARKYIYRGLGGDGDNDRGDNDDLGDRMIGAMEEEKDTQ